MTGFRNGWAGMAKFAMFAALMCGGFGCELISAVDREKIPGGSGGSGGAGGASSSSSGGGGNAECSAPEECTDPGNECVIRTCEEGKCGTSPVALGTALAMQTDGDCKVKQCDGAGMTADANDDADLPDDGESCTDDVCTAGVASNPPSAAGTDCGAGLTCNGNGQCTGCTTGDECPGQDDECQTRTCTAGVCGMSFTAAGTALAAQTDGDCKEDQCDGSGAVVAIPTNTDLPVDGNDCTDDVCTGGEPTNPNKMAGGVCAQMGGTVCNDMGACVECNVASTCPGVDNECQARTCNAGVCGIAFVALGTPAATQIAGDCKVVQCNGAGSTVTANADSDLPNDSNPCTDDVCTAGVSSNPPAMPGTTCGAGQVCDAAGACTGCVDASTCPGQDTDCATRTCNNNTCGVSFTAAGTATGTQLAGDCKKNTCDGAGAIVAANDDADLPVDGVQCTNDVCTAGSPSNPPASSGAVCSEMGGTVCNGGGLCVECLAAATCAGTDTDCKSRTCLMGACGFANTAPGTVTSVQTAADCQENQCDGNGSSTSVAKNTDLPVDGVQCTNDVCTAGAPSNPPTASGVACNENGGLVCSGAGTCVECVMGSTCPDGVCMNNVCQPAACDDGVENGTETDVDCGGSCPTKCALTLGCLVDGVAGDCASGICTGNVCSQVNGCDYTNATDLTGGAPTSVTFPNGNFTYNPKCIKVTVGTDVTFNGNFGGHPLQGGVVVGGTTTPAASGPFVPLTDTGTTKTFDMDTAGAFPYYCVPHATIGMNGAVLVVAP